MPKAQAVQQDDDADVPQVQQQARELSAHRVADHYTINISKVDRNARNSIDPVPVGVNGVTYAIKRGANVVVPAAVVEVLRNAVETNYEQVGDGTSRAMVAIKVQSYPFQILSGPHARDKSPVPGASIPNQPAKQAA